MRRFPFLRLACCALLALISARPAAAQLRVASLHPLLTDLARQVGGDRVQILELLKPGQDPHHFSPAPKDVTALQTVPLILASGKGLESAYLKKLTDSLGAGSRVVEVGKLVPSLTVNPNDALFLCCPAHAQGGLDPHWWHSPENMRRAARILADEFSRTDPAGAAVYKANADSARKRFAALGVWAKRELSQIPRANRKLVTAHAAFGYFCKDFGFKSVPVLGLSRTDEPTAQYLQETISVIRSNGIRAVFPEDNANPKILAAIATQSGAALAGELVADGCAPHAHTFETMLRHNVGVLVKALK